MSRTALGVEAGGTWLSALAVFFVTFIRPMTRRGRERRQQEKLMRLWFTGATEIAGVSPEIVPAPIQLSQLHTEVASISERVDEILRRVSVPGT